jgi:potassium channel subfamily K
MDTRSLLVPAIILFLYYIGSVIFFIYIEEWGVLDSFYFMSSTVSLVGLGDIYPETNEGKIYTSIFALIGNSATLILFGVTIWRLSEKIIDKYPFLTLLPKISLDPFDKDTQDMPSIKFLIFKTFIKLFTFLLIMIMIFTLLFKWVEELNFIDSFYFSVCVVTTLGYGDIAPISRNGKILFICCSLFGTCIVAKVLSLIMDLMSEYHLRKYIKNIRRNRIELSSKEYVNSIIEHAPRAMNKRRLSEIFNDIPESDNYALTI